MHVPFGWVSLFGGIVAAIVYVIRRINGEPVDLTMLVAAIAAIAAGWMACVSLPRLEKMIQQMRQPISGQESGPASSTSQA
jgi:hypothetical protein